MEASSTPVPMLPCLVLDPDGINHDGRTVLLDSKGRCHTRNIEALGSNMRYSLTWQAGWILASDLTNLRTFLSNPQTLDKIELPHFAHQQLLPRQFECALSDKPTNDGCVVVVLHPDEATLWYCLIGGSGGWIKYDYDVGTWQMDTKGLVWEKIVMHFLSPCQGKFYYLIRDSELGVLEFNPLPTTRVMMLDDDIPDPNPGRSTMAHFCSFEMDGELCMFFAYYFWNPCVTTSIALYKLGVVAEGKQWRQVDEIGEDRALLWSGLHAGSCSVTRFGLEPNCVYWINRNDRLMRIFSLREKIERVCEPSKDLPEDLPKVSSKAFWLLPME